MNVITADMVIAIAEANPGLGVALLSKVYPRCSHTVAKDDNSLGECRHFV